VIRRAGVRMLLVSVAVLLLAACDGAAAGGQTIVGPARVLDGDSLEVRGRQIRLFGIDAPEGGQTCLDQARRSYPCGERARAALIAKIGGSTVRCVVQDTDRYERLVAVCYRGDEDLNGWLVAEGWALAYRRYSRDYVDAEDAARRAGVGMWRGRFEKPWEYRERQRTEAQARQAERAPGCNIKGNINSRGERIYHLPGQRHYEQTRITESQGERYFCSEAEARAAGWRRARE